MNIFVAVVMAVAIWIPGGVIKPMAPIPSALLWSDEFNGPAGTRPDPNKWKVEVVDQGDTEQQSYVDDPRTAALDGQGNMVLTAIKETSATGRPYISGRLSNGFSNRPFFSAYGRWVARMLIPAGQGVWPAFWGLGDWN